MKKDHHGKMNPGAASAGVSKKGMAQGNEKLGTVKLTESPKGKRRPATEK
jgi:hypothetical protein